MIEKIKTLSFNHIFGNVYNLREVLTGEGGEGVSENLTLAYLWRQVGLEKIPLKFVFLLLKILSTHFHFTFTGLMQYIHEYKA